MVDVDKPPMQAQVQRQTDPKGSFVERRPGWFMIGLVVVIVMSLGGISVIDYARSDGPWRVASQQSKK